MAVSENQLSNPGFEQGLGRWLVGSSDPASCAVVLGVGDVDPGVSGSFNLKLVDDADTSYCYAHQYVQAQAGHDYMVCALIGGAPGEIMLDFRDGSPVRQLDGVGIRTGLGVVTGNGRLCVEATAPGSTAFVRVVFTSMLANEGITYFDEGLLLDLSADFNTLSLLFMPGSAHDVGPEFEEPSRNDLVMMGQHNCVAEAVIQAPTVACPHESTGVLRPALGFRILDSAVRIGDLGYELASQGFQIIPPGPVVITAHYGLWDDENVDRLIQDLTPAAPGNEYVRIHGGVFAWIEPGDHPTIGQAPNPEEYEEVKFYDFQYRPVGGSPPAYYINENGPVVFLDGSLLHTYTVWTESYMPGSNPFHGPLDRRDIDIYTAMAPGPVVNLYGALAAPLVLAVQGRLAVG